MTLEILKSGPQTTIQAAPRVGQRHLGVPYSGPADPLSMALANRLVGNESYAPALEATLGGLSLRFGSPAFFAITGATAHARLADRPLQHHRTIQADAGEELHVGPATLGARVYLAFAGGLQAETILGSSSTYLPAKLGGHEGRSLVIGDRLSVNHHDWSADNHETPREFQPPLSTSWAIRACDAAETGLLRDRRQLFDRNFRVASRCDRMGIMLEGPGIDVNSDGGLASAPVFPGTVQCPDDGRPFLLSVDAQTTGGYARVAQVARADRHLLGQIRPGDHVRLLWRDPQSAIKDLRSKLDYWCAWLDDIELVI
ncbi:MAG: biotin-dependent carboxyltransferase family protein [Gammaproteobacteria bacterium]|nr:biotin-dependent carboxyltransferase family protein [Gammaproteobacteria bacterium]MBU2678024.1 biotin-dependent carboxyltransferase family protein [Gammaproteobacteria bacterium]NNC56000.1 biotin-dependent carboxyltransferase family protein [Woeseiaceae bacterium]NNL51759.1 biotin-dependent carboxyltransferase family protein [Woeseiaceae bacterium]